MDYSRQCMFPLQRLWLFLIILRISKPNFELAYEVKRLRIKMSTSQSGAKRTANISKLSAFSDTVFAARS